MRIAANLSSTASRAALLGLLLLAAGAPAATAQPGALEITGLSLQATQSIPGAGPGGQVQQPYPYTQAGGHPQALTAGIELNGEAGQEGGAQAPAGQPEDLVIELPPGLTVNPLAVARCPLAQAAVGDCASATQVGVDSIELFGGGTLLGPVFDVRPEAGQPAELALEDNGATLLLDGRLARLADGYGLELVAHGLPPIGVQSAQITLWGTPAEAIHDPQRGLDCGESSGAPARCTGGGQPAEGALAPFLTMGSDCAAGAQTVSAWTHAYQEPQRWARASAAVPALSGCQALPFAPTLQAGWETPLAEEASGMALQVREPPGGASAGVSAAPLRQASITLPQGVAVNPAALAGVRACAAGGAEGIDMPSGLDAAGGPLSPETVGEGEEAGPDGLKRLAAGHCPQASILGDVEARSPLLAEPLSGAVYLAQPLCGGPGQPPCTEADAAEGRLARVYLELVGGAEPGPAGVVPQPAPSQGETVLKLAAELALDPATGQVSLRIAEAPQLPIEELRIALNGGPRALLANPAVCGTASTSADLAPWSGSGLTPEGIFAQGTPQASPSSSIQISGCQPASGFSPGFLAGTISPLAGASSALSVSVARRQREPYLRRLQVSLPPGLSARLAGVALCPEPGASAGACPAASAIGGAMLEAGAGSDPLELHGRVYLTGPYQGAPFGLAIVVEGAAGPFDLGEVVVRARVDVDLRTAAITITSDPLPQIVLGVPLRLRSVSLQIDREGLIVNPTDCAAMKVDGEVEGAPAGGGAAALASVSSPFAAADCKRLPFAPTLRAGTQAAGRLAQNGASLSLTIANPEGGPNLRTVRLALPQRMPARAQAVRSACAQSVFEGDPAACPAGAVVGQAKLGTPMLGGPLVGPVYLVAAAGGGGRGSRGALPQLVLVLEGEGVRIDLAGALSVSAANVTSASFDAIPDIPIHELQMVLPRGRHSILGAGASLCAHRGRLRMQVVLGAQNRARVSREVKLTVAGCALSARRARRRPRARVRFRQN